GRAARAQAKTEHRRSGGSRCRGPGRRSRLPMSDLLSNPVLIATTWAWALTQLFKFLFYSIRERRVSLRYLTSMGGMPSSHSATVAGLATATGLREGLRSTTFALALVFAFVVMYDAA